MKPAAITRGVPNRSTTEPIFVEESATSAPAGRKASAVCSADQPSRDCMYCVTRNWKPTYEPKKKAAPRLARIWLPERSTPSRISGCELRRSMVTKTVSSTATARKDSRVRAEAQPASGAWTTVKTSSSIEAVPVTAPGRSYPFPESSRLLCGISLRPASSAIRAMGAGSSMVRRQLTSVSSPDRTRPMEKPVAAQVV